MPASGLFKRQSQAFNSEAWCEDKRQLKKFETRSSGQIQRESFLL